MGQHSCCNKQKVKRGLWSPEEDEKLITYISANGHGNWSSVPRLAGLQRCGKSCRLRWINYLRPDLKRGSFSTEEEAVIIRLHSILGNRWSRIAKHLPGRTDNEVKNFWNTSIKKKLLAHDAVPSLETFHVLDCYNGTEERFLPPNTNPNLVPNFRRDQLHLPSPLTMLRGVDHGNLILERNNCSPTWLHFPPIIPPLSDPFSNNWSQWYDRHYQLDPNQQDQNFIMGSTPQDSHGPMNPSLTGPPYDTNAIPVPEMPELYEIIIGGVNLVARSPPSPEAHKPSN